MPNPSSGLRGTASAREAPLSMALLPAARIDRASPVPFYFQLRKALSEEIATGRWKPGDRLPSEPDICKHFDVSRTTVRQALAELEVEGMIRRDKGRGTFVALPRTASWFLQSSHGFFDEAKGDGHEVVSRVLRSEIAPLGAWACDALELSEGERGVVLERLRWVDGRVVMFVETYLPKRFADAVLDADLEGGSLYRTLEERMGCRVASGRRVVEATTAEEKLATMLEISPGSPLLYVESVSYDEAGEPFECYRAWHRADRTKIQVQVVDQDLVRRAGLKTVGMRFGEPA
jgi:GntR family transcriptional regulator